MKILVVGCKGMLGTDLMEVLRPSHEVIGIDRPEIDIGLPDQCFERAREFHPEVIVNAAAFTRVDECETNTSEAFSVNGAGPGNLARAAEITNSLMVHYSTDYIFDGTKSGAYLEEDEPNPQSVYGKSKLLGESLVRQICRNYLILRTSWLFGRNGPNFIRTIVNAAQNDEPLRVVNDQRGSPTYSKDLAAHTLKMIEASCLGIYHVTNSGSCTWFELASEAVEWAGIRNVSITPVSTSEFKRPAARPANSVLANARLEQSGFPLMRSWQAAAREYVLAEFRTQKSEDRIQHS
jgi:dTDP-4-dehydrorhamnose reductase